MITHIGAVMHTDETIDKYFYITGWIILTIVAAVAVYFKIFGTAILEKAPKCTLHAVTGYYCPGCGGTRAVFALFRGDIIRSFKFHPFVPYTALVGGWFMISQTLQRITRGRLHIGMHFRAIYMWIAIALILVNCLVKNAFILIYGIHLLD